MSGPQALMRSVASLINKNLGSLEKLKTAPRGRRHVDIDIF